MSRHHVSIVNDGDLVDVISAFLLQHKGERAKLAELGQVVKKSDRGGKNLKRFLLTLGFGIETLKGTEDWVCFAEAPTTFGAIKQTAQCPGEKWKKQKAARLADPLLIRKGYPTSATTLTVGISTSKNSPDGSTSSGGWTQQTTSLSSAQRIRQQEAARGSAWSTSQTVALLAPNEQGPSKIRNNGNNKLGIQQLQQFLSSRTAPTWNCNSCLHDNSMDANFCPSCGTPKPQPPQKWNCTSCNKMNEPDAKFCPSCGFAALSKTNVAKVNHPMAAAARAAVAATVATTNGNNGSNGTNDSWNCSACTLENDSFSTSCAACGANKPPSMNMNTYPTSSTPPMAPTVNIGYRPPPSNTNVTNATNATNGMNGISGMNGMNGMSGMSGMSGMNAMNAMNANTAMSNGVGWNQPPGFSAVAPSSAHSSATASASTSPSSSLKKMTLGERVRSRQPTNNAMSNVGDTNGTNNVVSNEQSLHPLSSTSWGTEPNNMQMAQLPNSLSDLDLQSNPNVQQQGGFDWLS